MKRIIALHFLLSVIAWMPVHAQNCAQLFIGSNPLLVKAEVTIEAGHYVTGRSYYEYMNAFGNAFVDDMLTLHEDQVWVDLGAGIGRALKDFSEYKAARKEKSPLLIGISTQHPDYKIENFPIKWLGGRLWENIPSVDLPARIDRATDYYGILSYTGHLSNYLNDVFDRMPVGGKFYSYLSDRDVVRPGNSLLNRVLYSQSITDYLKDIPHLLVEEKIIWNYFTLQKMRVLTLTKTGNVQFPELEMVSYKEDSPPYRTFIRK